MSGVTDRGFLECLVHHDDSGQVDIHVRIGGLNVVTYLTNCRGHAGIFGRFIDAWQFNRDVDRGNARIG